MSLIPIHPSAKALIFDCDGTLADSMPLHMKAWEYSMKKYGLPFDYNFFFSKKGMKELDIVQILIEEEKLNFNPHEIISAKHEYFLNNISDIKPINEVVEIVKKYQNVLPMAVVSGGTRKVVYEELKILGIDKQFNVILTADDSIKPKPAPDIFLQAAKELKIQPEYCQVFEDGDLGIEAALQANMIVTDVRNYIH
ncbi:MAG: HAD family phosphatase [Melioribacter sp.]|nr:HAD family phosphatase [Melioribacter sp.]